LHGDAEIATISGARWPITSVIMAPTVPATRAA
jgi:hypothetical protein